MNKIDSIFNLYKEGKHGEFSKELYKYMENESTGQGVPGLDPSTNGINAAKMKKTCKNCKTMPCKCK